MKEDDLHILTKEEIVQQLYSMEVIDGKDYPIKILNFLVPNKNYDPDNFSQEIENSEEDFTYIDSIRILKSAIDGGIFGCKIVNRRNSKQWLDNHSKICKISFMPMAVYINAQRHENGRRDFCTEENINNIIKFSEQYGGIFEMK